MKSSRRAFIRRVVALGSISMTFWVETDADAQPNQECTLPTNEKPVRFKPAEKKVVPRLSVAEIADPTRATQLQSLRNAIGTVRNLPSIDVTSWTKHVAQHCIHCAPSNPQNIHFAWQFLPWHRGLLYFLERILRLHGKNDNLRLVYWNWEHPDQRTLPAIFGAPNQPLFWSNRNLTGPQWPLDPEAVDVQPLLATPDFRTFGGTAQQGQPVPASFSGPHADVHNAFSPGDMSDLQYSPRDPVFYAHHGNIDRLWSSWVAAGHANPDFGDARAYFYDENRKWRFLLFNDLRDENMLGYRYSSLMRPLVPPLALSVLPLLRKGPIFTMQMPQLEQLRGLQDRPRYLLIENIRGLEKLPADAVTYGIFSVKPEPGRVADSTPGYLGRASRVRTKAHDHSVILSTALNLTRKASDIHTKVQTGLELTIGALDDTRRLRSPVVPLTADNLRIVG